jgi:hypothetical protein
MTRTFATRFRRAAFAVAAAAALTVGAAAAAQASTAGGQPGGTYSPYSQPGQYHQQRHCEFDWLSGITVDHDGQAQDLGYGLAPEQAPYGQPNAHEPKAEKVEAFQLVRVCEIGEHLTVTDVGKPYVEETEQRQLPPEPYVTPTDSPSAYVTPASVGPVYASPASS